MFPKSGATMEADVHFRALLNISYGVPNKGTLPQGPLHGIPRRESPPSFIFQSPRYMSPPPPNSRFPGCKGAPMERDAHIRSLYLHIFRSPQ